MIKPSPMPKAIARNLQFLATPAKAAPKRTLPTTEVFTHTGDSANIAFYGGPESGKFWLEVTRHDDYKRTIERPLKPTCFTFHVRMDVPTGNREVARFDYTPKSKPKPGRLPDVTVNRVLRDWIKEHQS